ncbi:HAD family hydrolase [Streptomyces carminius]|uniref:HAD family hydrolase n=1 Tax=Streptomyces carminius TaxID=2665496 RepID=A0A2M8M012_9ACTN|nr:HAD family hydrolase [Streptomyces carminius]PJE97519.1 HAD family hydrolase [Streptomyces carminius]
MNSNGRTGASGTAGLVEAAACVLLDFDGPVCRLFSGHPSAAIAGSLRDLLRESGERELLTAEVLGTGDTHLILRTVAEHRHGTELARRIEARMTEEELRAADTARPTPYADPLIWTLVATGRRVAVATNNSPLAVERYLRGRRLAAHFAGHVHGRSRDLRLLKPHPHCLLEALRSTGTAARDALMIGDAPSDLAAARATGVPFLGFARNGRKEAELRGAGAGHVVRSMQEVLASVTGTPAPR